MTLKDFYSSRPWIKVSKAYMKSRGYICEVCGNRNVMLAATRYGKPSRMICHHKIPLTDENYTNPEISLATENLQVRCITCHNRIHGDKVGTVNGLRFDNEGHVVPQ
jgi:5-methylcytosine-specific restriction endonuclease McrA